MIGQILIDEKTGKVASPVSDYQPEVDVKEITLRLQQDFHQGSDLQHKPFTEFNDLGLLTRADVNQKRWNFYRMPQSADVDEAWRWDGIRPVTRNRILGVVAQMSSNIIMP